MSIPIGQKNDPNSQSKFDVNSSKKVSNRLLANTVRWLRSDNSQHLERDRIFRFCVLSLISLIGIGTIIGAIPTIYFLCKIGTEWKRQAKRIDSADAKASKTNRVASTQLAASNKSAEKLSEQGENFPVVQSLDAQSKTLPEKPFLKPLEKQEKVPEKEEISKEKIDVGRINLLVLNYDEYKACCEDMGAILKQGNQIRVDFSIDFKCENLDFKQEELGKFLEKFGKYIVAVTFENGEKEYPTAAILDTFLQSCSILERLAFVGCSFDKGKAERLSQFNRLKELTLVECEFEEPPTLPHSITEFCLVNPKGKLPEIDKLTRLKKLHMEGNFKVLPDLKKCIHLSQLCCVKCSSEDETCPFNFDYLCQFKQLHHLQIYNVNFGELPKIAFPDLNTFKLNHVGINGLEFAECPNLQSIELCSCEILESLEMKECEQLKTVNVNNCPNFQKIDFAHLPELEHLKMTKCLEFSKAPKHDQVSLPKLRTLDLRQTGIKQLSLEGSTLQTLYVGGPKIQTITLHQLRALKELNVGFCSNLNKVTLSHLDVFSAFKTVAGGDDPISSSERLEELSLTNLPQLKLLHFYGCEKIKKLEVAECENHRPPEIHWPRNFNSQNIDPNGKFKGIRFDVNPGPMIMPSREHMSGAYP